MKAIFAALIVVFGFSAAIATEAQKAPMNQDQAPAADQASVSDKAPVDSNAAGDASASSQASDSSADASK
jgi:hypothetical protein